MDIDGISFSLGFMIGVMVIVLAAWAFMSRKARIFTASLNSADLEKKRLNDALSSAQSEMAVLNERAMYAHSLREELNATRSSLDQSKSENSDLMAKIATLSMQNEKTVEFFNQRLADLSNLREQMKETFVAISKDALIKNADVLNSSFKQSMEHFFKASEKDRLFANDHMAQVINPLKESLLSVDKKIHELETSRQGAYSGLKEQIEGLLKSQTTLQKETQNLSRALHAPTIRGRWGEMQLRRVVELAGLSSHCDFVEQKSIRDDEDVLRPDMIVTLPKNKKIVIDAKAPLDFFRDSEDPSFNEERKGQEFAASLRRHLLNLKKKSYHSVVGDSPEFVVMFLPGEAFLHQALVADPTLLDYAAQNEIIIATPITLIALLKAIAFGFKQEAIANNIEEVRRLSQQLIDRVNKVSSHFEKLGKSLRQASEAYNQTLSSLDSRVLVTARKLAEIKSVTVAPEEFATLPYLDIVPREVNFREIGALDEES